MAESLMEPKHLVFRWITIHSHVFYSLITCYLIVTMECTFHSYKIMKPTPSFNLSGKSVNNTMREKVFDLGIAMGSTITHGLSLICILICACLLEVKTFYESIPPILVTIISTFNAFLNLFGFILLMFQSEMHTFFTENTTSFPYMIRGAFYISTFSLIISIISSILNIFFPSRNSVKYTGDWKQETKTVASRDETSEAIRKPEDAKPLTPTDVSTKPAGELGAFMTY